MRTRGSMCNVVRMRCTSLAYLASAALLDALSAIARRFALWSERLGG